MTPERWLEVLRVDADRLLTVAARGMDSDVPCCPGWTVRDVVDHVAAVYWHKTANLQSAAAAEFPERPADVDSAAWFVEGLEALVAELVERGPAEPTYTWWPRDRTVGFWYRRMAQETVVHRVDVEDALGSASPVPDDVAEDGIDELLRAFLAEGWDAEPPDAWDGVDPQAGAGRTVSVEVPGVDPWLLTLGPSVIAVDRDDAAADLTVAGDASAVLLWLWGRRPDDAVRISGDAAVQSALRGRLRLATQ